MRFTRLAAAFALAACVLAAQVATNANKGYQTPEQRANVAKGLGSANRDAQQHPHDIIAAMNLKPGDSVADVGTGIGYMLPYLSDAVGPSGKVFAEDIYSDFLDKARASAKEHNLTNVEFILGTQTDPKLPAHSLDAVLVLEVYHHFNYPGQMLAGISNALKPGGRLFLVDFHKSFGSNHIRLDKPGVIEEVDSNGFSLVSESERSSDNQYMAVFTPQHSNP